jgi:hypothetical protein
MRSRLAYAVAALCVASAASADWKNDYDRGVKAAADGNWAEAEAAMRSAIAQEAKPSERKRFQGVVHKVYVPHYYAGLAAWRQGDCRAALDFWSNRDSKEVVALIGELNATQNKGVADCNAKLAAADQPQPPVATVTPPVSAATPKPDTPVVTSTTRPDTPLATTTAPTRPPAAPAAKPPQAPTTEPRVPVAGPAPAALVQSLESFLAGRYADVVASDPNGFGDDRAKAQGFLLRAAARYTLAQLSGNEAPLDTARADVRAARAANGGLTPDELLFSPRFRTFWSATR